MNEAIRESTDARRPARRMRAAWREQTRRAALVPAWLSSFVARRIRWLFDGMLWAGLGLLVAAALLRVTLRDQVVALALVYYAMPPLVLCGLATVISVGLWWRRSRWGAAGALGLAVACATWSYATTWFHNAPAPATGPTCRVLLWNVARGALGWTNIVAAIRERDADIVGLVEAGRDPQRTREHLERELPGYHVYTGPLGFALLARGPIRHNGITLFSHALCHSLSVDLPQMSLDVVLVDLLVSFRTSRGPSLRALGEALAPDAGKPVLVMGDFNTPLDSAFFDRLRMNYANAFETAGAGYAATWPLPLPVLTLDQIWLSPALRATECRAGAAWCSDHRWVQAVITRR